MMGSRDKRRPGGPASTSPAPGTNSSPLNKHGLSLKSRKKPGSSPGITSPSPNGSKPTSPYVVIDEKDEKIDITNSSPSKIARFNHEGTENCPCGGTKPDSWKIDCSKCTQIWHADCVSLNGISKDSISKMMNYLCPFCYVPPVPAPHSESSPYICHTCLNTATVRNINQWSCISSLSSKIDSIGSLNEELSHVEQLDARIKHLLTNIDSLNEFQSKPSPSLDESFSALNNRIDELTKTLSHNADNVSSHSHNDQKLLLLEENMLKINEKLEKLTESQNSCPPASTDTDTILSKIDSLLSLPSYSSGSMANPSQQPPTTDSTPHVIDHGEQHVAYTRENFVDNDEADKLSEFLSTCKFNSEGGRQVKAFGEPYKYNGSKGETDEFPEVIKELLNHLNTEYCIETPQLNSCLINKFDSPQSSLSEHSDDEMSIAPESSIFTVSLGDTCNINFREVHSGAESTHQCSDRSLYIMTRRSQEHYKHSILPGQIENVRYSLTFRCVSWRYRNSTILLGDSNTGKLKFGEEKGTFGKATPGKRVWVPTIDKIDPNVTTGYSNIVILCGINDIRHSNVRTQADIHNIYLEFKRKIELIQHVNKRARIIICPLLPTRLVNITKKVDYFNTLILNDLIGKHFNISLVPGFVDFIDQNDLLHRKFCREEGDYLHLNLFGTNVLGNKIKTEIFNRKSKRRNGGDTNGRLYSKVAAETYPAHYQ